jgi:cytochrome P450
MDQVLNETMRLMPPVRAQNRDAIDDHQIGSVKVLAGTSVIIPLAVIHQSKDIWGEDAHLYNPDRWSKSDSQHFSSFMPFGAGNRICLGRNLARMEAKLILSFLLRRFTLSVAPGYRHAPGIGETLLWPKYGVQLRIKNVAT